MPVMVRSKRVEAPVVDSSVANEAIEQGEEQHGRRLAVFLYDTETTGLGKHDRIVEFAICTATCEDLTASVSAKSWLINPGISIANSHIHGITDAMVKDQPTFPQVWAQVVEWVNKHVDDNVDPVLVAHNARFDERLLRQDLLRTGAPAPPPHWQFACSLYGVARKAWPLLPKHSIGFLCEELSIELTGALHRAAADVDALDMILLAAASHLGGWTKIEKLLRQSMKPFELELEQTVSISIQKQVIQRQASVSSYSDAGVAHHIKAAQASSATMDAFYYVKNGSVYHLHAMCKSLRRSKEVSQAAELPAARTLCALCKAQRGADDATSSSSSSSSSTSSMRSSRASSGPPSQIASAEQGQQQQQQRRQRQQTELSSASTPLVAVAEASADESGNTNPGSSSYYYVPSGRVYHVWRTCKTLSSSQNVLQQPAPPDDRTLCKVCG